jgi:hypothetical protein
MDAAESHSRTRSRRFVVAFAFIIAVTIAEMVDEGPSFWDWLVVAVSAAFLLQQLSHLTKERNART